MADAKGGVVVRAGLIGLLQLTLSAGGSIAAVVIYQERSQDGIKDQVTAVEKQAAVLEQRVVAAENQADDVKEALKTLASKIDSLKDLMLVAERRRGRTGS